MLEATKTPLPCKDLLAAQQWSIAFLEHGLHDLMPGGFARGAFEVLPDRAVNISVAWYKMRETANNICGWPRQRLSTAGCESLCRPPKAFVLSCDNSPAQRSKFNGRRVFHVSMRSWPLADKFVFRGVGNQPWQP
jgi:hypothetical protein